MGKWWISGILPGTRTVVTAFHGHIVLHHYAFKLLQDSLQNNTYEI
jgi:hypothetical protein